MTLLETTAHKVRYRNELLTRKTLRLEVVDGLKSGAARRGDDTRVGGRPGAHPERREGDVLDILLAGSALGVGPSDALKIARFDERMSLLRRLFSPRAGLGLLEAEFLDGTIITTRAQAADAISIGEGTAWYRKLAIPMVGPDGHWFLPTVSQTVSIAASPTDFTFVHPGSEAGYRVTITLTGPLTNPRVRNQDTGIYVECLVTLALGEQLVLDGFRKTALVGATNVIGSVRHVGDFQWLWLEPGNNAIRVTSAVTGGSVKIDFEPPW